MALDCASDDNGAVTELRWIVMLKADATILSEQLQRVEGQGLQGIMDVLTGTIQGTAFSFFTDGSRLLTDILPKCAHTQGVNLPPQFGVYYDAVQELRKVHPEV